MQDYLHLREKGQKTYPEIDPPSLLEEKEIAAAHHDISSPRAGNMWELVLNKLRKKPQQILANKSHKQHKQDFCLFIMQFRF